MDIITKYINQSKDLDKAIEHLSTKKQIYIDLEFDKNHFQYGFHLCLMQIFDGEKNCYLIDPLGEIDIKTIFPIIENEDIQLVSYAFNEDMKLLSHLGAKPNNILDLAIVLRLLDYDSLSMNNALATFVDDIKVETDKKSTPQMSNWLNRPLTKKQLQYAQKDVLFLPQLEEKLLSKINQLQREDWVQQEMIAFEQHDWEDDVVSNYLLTKDQKMLTLREWIRFQAIMTKRESLSEELNRPSFKVVNKQIMFDIARTPKLIAKWQHTKGVHPKLRTPEIQAEFQQLLIAAKEEIKVNKIGVDDPSIPFMTKEEKELLRERKRRIQKLKNEIFEPLKEQLKLDYGVNFASYILSNKKIDEFISRKAKPLDYQMEIYREINKKLNLPLSTVFYI